MEALEQLALTSQVSFRAVWSALARPLVWVVLAGFVVPAAMAVALVNFAHPALSPLMVPVVKALGGEAALHYPGLLARLPALLERLGWLTNVLTVTLLLGWAGTVTAYGSRGISATSAFFTTLQRFVRLVLLGGPVVLLHTIAAQLSAAALADLPHRLISALAHLMAAFALEAAVLGWGMIWLPVLVRGDLPLSRVWEAFQRALHWSTVAALGFGLAMAGFALASRIVLLRAHQLLTTRQPDGALFVVFAAAAVTAIGIVVFAAASGVLAAALDEGWE